MIRTRSSNEPAVPPAALAWLLLAIWLAPAVEGHGETGSWTTLAPAPTKRTEVSAATLDKRIYVVGGFAEPSLGNIAHMAVTDAVEVYDPSSDRWDTAAPLPARLHHAGTAVVDGRLYVVGGFTTGFLSLWNPVDSAYRYDPAADEWEILPPMTAARGALGVAALDGRIYAVGGIGPEGNTGAVEVFDPASNQWRTKAALPTPRDHLAVAVLDGRLYAIGGRLNGSYSHNLGTLEVYDPGRDAWRAAAPLPTPRSGIAAGVIGPSIYVVGGEAPEGTFATNEAYSPGEDRWTSAAPMPTARHGLGAAVYEGRLYVLAGGPTPGGSFSGVTERFDPVPLRTSGAGRSRASAAQVGAAMALLATFQDADVLPPESSPEADRVIRAVIQLQSVFMKSTDPAVTELLHEALTRKFGPEAEPALHALRTRGWTSRSLEALVEYTAGQGVWNEAVTRELGRYNIGPAEFDLLATLFRRARAALAKEGRDVHVVFAGRRQAMPGSPP